MSIFGVGGIVGGLVGGPITAAVGPKWCQLGNNLIWIACGLLQALATPGSAGTAMLMTGRTLAGVAAGVCCAAVPMYVNDVSPTQVRGAFGVFHQLFVTIGILVATVLGMNAVFGNTSLWFLLYGIFVIPAGINFGVCFCCPFPRAALWLPLARVHALLLGREAGSKAGSFRSSLCSYPAPVAQRVALRSSSSSEGWRALGSLGGLSMAAVVPSVSYTFFCMQTAHAETVARF